MEHIPIKVINLDRNPDRLLSVKNQLDKYGLKFERFRAVDGKNTTDTELFQNFNIKPFYANKKLDYTWDKISRGQKGCAVSHYLILEDMIKQELPYLIIIEDDMILCEDFLDIANKYFEATPDDFDLIYMGNQIEIRNNLTRMHQFPSDICIVKYIKSTSFCTHGLLWSLKGAKKVYENLKNNGLSVIDINIKHMDINSYCWLRGPVTPHEKSLNLWHERSSGLIFQNKDFETQIN